MRDTEAPPLHLFLSEIGRATVGMGVYLATRRFETCLPRGAGGPVLVLPGLMADDRSTNVLRGVLRRLDYRVHGWRQGRNIGPTAEAVAGMTDRLAELADRYGAPVDLVGWSLGGIFARQLARRMPEQVGRVVTMGSPFALSHDGQSRAHTTFQRYAHLHVERPQLPLTSERTPMPVPATSIYSRLDGIVAWQACLDVPSATTENIAVHSSHLGLGHHPAVLWAVADRLAQPAGQWAPFVAPPLLRLAYPRPDVPGATGGASTAAAAA